MTIKSISQNSRQKKSSLSPVRFLHRLWRASPFYRLSLMGKSPKYLSVLPADPWPGDLNAGRLLWDGKLGIGQDLISLTDLWMPARVDTATLEALHEFAWLRDLRAIGDNAARRLCRQLITNWIERNQDWRLLPWQAGITGQRIANWIALYDFFCSSADESFREMFFKEIACQTRHLALSLQAATTPLERLQGLKGLIYAAVTFPGESGRLITVLPDLDVELEAQILPDGGHCSRNPQTHLLVLRDLIDIRAMLRLIHYTIPLFVQKYISLMVPIVRLFRHGDGCLASFGNVSNIPSPIIDMVLSLADVRGRPPENAPSLKFERAASKGSLILLNVGSKIASLPLFTGEEGTGSLNFEWSVGRDRLVTQGDIILQTARGKHLHIPGHLESDSIKLYRKNQQGHAFLDVTYGRHDEHSYKHRRQLCLASNQADLRGEDTICVPHEAMYGIRFVFNEKSEVSLTTSGRSGLIRLPVNDNSDMRGIRQWRLLVSGAEEIFHESISAFQSILLLGHLKPNEPASIQWAFRQN
jgi:uncharacterized heparinase superfamily protein